MFEFDLPGQVMENRWSVVRQSRRLNMGHVRCIMIPAWPNDIVPVLLLRIHLDRASFSVPPEATVTTDQDVAVTSCVGTPNTISIKPHATVQVGSSTQSVGTLSGSALATAISKALSSACPPRPSGGTGHCTATPTITNIHYTVRLMSDYGVSQDRMYS